MNREAKQKDIIEFNAIVRVKELNPNITPKNLKKILLIFSEKNFKIIFCVIIYFHKLTKFSTP